VLQGLGPAVPEDEAILYSNKVTFLEHIYAFSMSLSVGGKIDNISSWYAAVSIAVPVTAVTPIHLA